MRSVPAKCNFRRWAFRSATSEREGADLCISLRFVCESVLRRCLHPELIEEKGEDIRLLRDAFVESGAHAVAGVAAEPQEDRQSGAAGGLETRGHLARVGGV